MFNFIIDIVDAIVDIWETWREKDEKILSKLICTIMTLHKVKAFKIEINGL